MLTVKKLNIPKEGTYFYDGLGNLSIMLCHMYYKPILFRRPIIYVPESTYFSCARLATKKELTKEGLHYEREI